jgi:hypothetical protein
MEAQSLPTFRSLYDSMAGKVNVSKGAYIKLQAGGKISCCVIGQIYCAAHMNLHGTIPFREDEAIFGGAHHTICRAMKIPRPSLFQFNVEVEHEGKRQSIYAELAFDSNYLTADQIIEQLDNQLVNWRKRYDHWE